MTDSVPPKPSHSTKRQSPSVCVDSGAATPSAVLARPQALAMQVATWQTVPWLAHWPPELQATQLPSPSHTMPMPSAQVVSSASGGCCGAPLTQVSPVQVLPSSGGASALSWTEVMLPLPSHCRRWQSPAV